MAAKPRLQWRTRPPASVDLGLPTKRSAWRRTFSYRQLDAGLVSSERVPWSFRRLLRRTVAPPAGLDNNRPVRRSRTIWFLTLTILLLSWAAPSALATWVCEGRTCGTTLWFCCCVSPTEAKDGNCGEGAASAFGSARSCQSDCNCVLTMRVAEVTTQTANSITVAPLLLPALLPHAPVCYGPVPTEVTARSIETRGPPLSRVALSVPTLRGPPAPDVSTIGS